VAGLASHARTCGLAAGLALLALGGLVGCDSTQSKNERAKLRATRELASREPQHVAKPNPDVHVTSASLVRGRRSTAIVVELRSRAPQPLTDVPIAVGVRTPGGRRVPLNSRKNLDWFQTHVPAIPAQGMVTWVFEGRRGTKVTGRPFARVGVPASPTISHAGSLPSITASPRPGARQGHAGEAKVGATPGVNPGNAVAHVRVDNGSDVPQYGLQVYALVRDGRRYVAAGKVAIDHLGTGQRKTVHVPLIGHARGRAAQVHALPTIFE
jgi:hypothetical protein